MVGSWKAPSESLMNPIFSSGVFSTASSSAAASAASLWRIRASDADSTMIGASGAMTGAATDAVSGSSSACGFINSETLDRGDLGDDGGHRRALLGDVVGDGAGRADANRFALLRLDAHGRRIHSRGRRSVGSDSDSSAPARTGSTIAISS